MGRPRGTYLKWEPQPETKVLLGHVRQVLIEYQSYLPLTLRQVFYRLVGAFGYDKKGTYERLKEHVPKARRALMIPMWALRDDGISVRENAGYDGPAHFWDSVRASIDGYRRNRQEGQPQFIELACEAAGMVPQLARVAEPFGVPVYSGGGFNSMSAVMETYDRVLTRDVPTVFLHVGDYDASGEHIFRSFTNDVEKFVRDIGILREGGHTTAVGQLTNVEDVQPGAEFRPYRIALTREQIREHQVEMADANPEDDRAWDGDLEGRTAQLEALPPDVLADIVREAIEARFDADAFQAIQDRESADRDRLWGDLDDAGL
jgi:hypothetical protein